MKRNRMANPDHLALLKSGVREWLSWRLDNEDVVPDLYAADLLGAELSGAYLVRADLGHANLSHANLSRAYLGEASLIGADLTGANLTQADLMGTDLSVANLSGADLCDAKLNHARLIHADLAGANLNRANFSQANLRKADVSKEANLSEASFFRAYLADADLSRATLTLAILTGADLTEANLSGANLSGADLTCAALLGTNLKSANLTDCRVYGISAWDVKLQGAIQKDLVITPKSASIITVDNLEVAQFLYLLLNNQKIRHVIDTITSKVVLILGRFTPERKAVLDAIRDELRSRDYLPVLFDFDKPSNRNITETVSTLAHMARFVIADITDAKSIPQELMAIVPSLPSVPVQPLLLESQREYGMFEHFRRYPWVLEPYLYDDQDRLLAALNEKVIGPAAAKAREQTGRPKP